MAAGNAHGRAQDNGRAAQLPASVTALRGFRTAPLSSSRDTSAADTRTHLPGAALPPGDDRNPDFASAGESPPSACRCACAAETCVAEAAGRERNAKESGFGGVPRPPPRAAGVTAQKHSI